jgi:hypothetical protein
VLLSKVEYPFEIADKAIWRILRGQPDKCRSVRVLEPFRKRLLSYSEAIQCKARFLPNVTRRWHRVKFRFRAIAGDNWHSGGESALKGRLFGSRFRDHVFDVR